VVVGECIGVEFHVHAGEAARALVAVENTDALDLVPTELALKLGAVLSESLQRVICAEGVVVAHNAEGAFRLPAATLERGGQFVLAAQCLDGLVDHGLGVAAFLCPSRLGRGEHEGRQKRCTDALSHDAPHLVKMKDSSRTPRGLDFWLYRLASAKATKFSESLSGAATRTDLALLHFFFAFWTAHGDAERDTSLLKVAFQAGEIPCRMLRPFWRQRA